MAGTSRTKFEHVKVDLVGGYYDVGDNVKFGTITVMSWSIVEYGKKMAASGELGHAMEAVKWGTGYLIKAHKWGTGYLIKAHPGANVLYGEVGDGNTDNYCWQKCQLAYSYYKFIT